MTTGSFEHAHKEWMDLHLKQRKGEAKRKLKSGHGYAEQEFLKRVWWPAFGTLNFLHPEYEVIDYFDGKRYIDFTYIRSGVKISIEVDPFGKHYDKMDRRQYSNQWVRHMHLVNDRWTIIRISLDDVKERPRLWQQLFQQLMGLLFGEGDLLTATTELTALERDIIRLAMRIERPIKLADVQLTIQRGYDMARKYLRQLEEKEWLLPQGRGKQRTHFWRLNPARRQLLL
ncbi:DNA-binding response regulator [Paenibacillus koleovorans]|uniref:DNA-binding response regulator n=1 Tax=Paenibacillus koleovorans TaxID=121608 RepID=UPI000FD885B5|nr:DNA-binding response regulator [Paenibacillus koleovorans]